MTNASLCGYKGDLTNHPNTVRRIRNSLQIRIRSDSRNNSNSIQNISASKFIQRSNNRTRLNCSGSNPFCASELQCKSARIRLKRLYNATWKQHHVVTSGNAPQLKASTIDSANSSQYIARGNSEIQKHSKRRRMPISSSSKLLHSGNPPSRW